MRKTRGNTGPAGILNRSLTARFCWTWSGGLGPRGRTRTVNIHEAKTHLSRLVDGVARLGEPAVIARAGKPVAKMVPLDAPEAKPEIRPIGFLRGQFQLPDDFGTMFGEELIRMFHGDLPNDGWPEEAGPRTGTGARPRRGCQKG